MAMLPHDTIPRRREKFWGYSWEIVGQSMMEDWSFDKLKVVFKQKEDSSRFARAHYAYCSLMKKLKTILSFSLIIFTG